ncbi:hypothetical protein D3C71_1380800 [compost metagenome]
MGMIRVAPRTSAMAKTPQKAQMAVPPVPISTPIRKTRARARAMLIRCRAGSRMGEPLIRPSSLAKAMTEPVKVMAPMATPRLNSTIDKVLMPPSAVMMPKASGA